MLIRSFIRLTPFFPIRHSAGTIFFSVSSFFISRRLFLFPPSRRAPNGEPSWPKRRRVSALALAAASCDVSRRFAPHFALSRSDLLFYAVIPVGSPFLCRYPTRIPILPPLPTRTPLFVPCWPSCMNRGDDDCPSKRGKGASCRRRRRRRRHGRRHLQEVNGSLAAAVLTRVCAPSRLLSFRLGSQTFIVVGGAAAFAPPSIIPSGANRPDQRLSDDEGPAAPQSARPVHRPPSKQLLIEV